MPNFTDYLLAPWKLLGVILGSSGPARPGATQMDGLCSYLDVGGQNLHVCRIMGYEMPYFVFIASLLILGIFVYACTRLLKQSTSVALALGNVQKEIRKLARDRLDVVAIRAVMQKQPFTRHAWDQFEETLLVSPSGDEAYSTQNIESAFSKTLLVEENIQSALYNAIPGILTGLGLLMTFVAILDGLSHVTVSANMDVQGIGGLINGLSGKFVSSIVAVTCAVSFVFVERVAYGRTDQAYRSLVTELASRFRRRTAEHLLYHIQSQLITQGALQREFAQVLTQIKDGKGLDRERTRSS